jgi:hypothetical protein
MKPFISQLAKFILIGAAIFFITFCIYAWLDPFKVVKSYDDYSYSKVGLNRDVVSTSMFTRNYKKYRYNSFILGSSRTLAYKPKAWKKYLNKGDEPFSFDGSGEAIWGIYRKLLYLDSMNVKIDNALIILDRDASFRYSGNTDQMLTIKDPVTSGESKLTFHFVFFNAFLTPGFLSSYIRFKLSGKYDPSMAGYIENRRITFDKISNEINIIDQEVEITKHEKEYYLKRSEMFYPRYGEKTDSVNRIEPKHLKMLTEIARILKKHKTNFKVVISPLYEQIKFTKKDKSILVNIFQHHLYDFSGKNSFTDNRTNYYEISHYRPIVGDSILHIIYK